MNKELVIINLYNILLNSFELDVMKKIVKMNRIAAWCGTQSLSASVGRGKVNVLNILESHSTFASNRRWKLR